MAEERNSLPPSPLPPPMPLRNDSLGTVVVLPTAADIQSAVASTGNRSLSKLLAAMEKSFLVLSLLVLTLPSQGTQAAIYILCGRSGSYTDLNGNIWVGDDPMFIQSGLREVVKLPSQKASILSTVRYFPYGSKNCYRITLTRRATITVDVAFYYGNYDGREQPPSFFFRIDGCAERSVQTTMDVVVSTCRLPEADTVNVCLAPDATLNIPFISAISIVEVAAD
ncbi:hypothetical protein EJ110_NYTH19444 [Nymphaea thermarum]|nr:hypothetical protein EJ110_NYTH19444 [Nymphaea thermarum]